MLRVEYPRDLMMIGGIFGVAAFVWASWGQEAPPDHWAWRVVLTALTVGGLVLAGFSIPIAVRHWRSPTAIQPSSRSFRVYVTVVVIEVVVAAIVGAIAVSVQRADLVAPLVLAVVGVHFFALAPVFSQRVLYLAAALLVVVALAAAFIPRSIAAPSFVCGLLGAPVFLAVGVFCAVAGAAVWREHPRAD